MTDPAPARPLTAQEAEIKRRYIAYLCSREFTPILRRIARPPVARYIFAFLAFMTTVGIPIAIYQLYRAMGHRSRRRRELIEMAERSVPIVTFPLIANVALTREEGRVAPALVVGSFEPPSRVTTGLMVDICERILEASLDADADADGRSVASLLEDEVYRPDRRRRLPLSFTKGVEVYAFDVVLVGDFLPDRTLNIPMIPCMSEPGREGRIVPIPWWVVEEALAEVPSDAPR